ncbi:MAG: hypothetical protein ACREMA_12130 [Longimicrobiales bacterium]
MKYSIMPLAALFAGLTLASQAAGQAPGKYRLVEVSGVQLPAVVELDNGCREEVDAASLTVESNGLWHFQASGREVCGDKTETETATDHGRWTMEGSTVRFIESDNDNGDGDDDDIDVHSGTLSGNTLRVRIGNSDRVLSFRKE